MNRAVFFNKIRPMLGGLTIMQVKGIELILDEWERRKLTDNRQLAYVLATAHHETGRKFTPITENLNYSADGLVKTFGRYFTRSQANAYARQPERIANRAYANRLGNGSEASGDGWRYRGRGNVQITGRVNYAKFGIEATPDKALDPYFSVYILVEGMIKGLFSGVKLSDYINGSKCDFYEARRIVNVLDKATEIKGIAEDYLEALEAAK